MSTTSSEALTSLLSMGYAHDQAELALKRSGGDVNRAVEILSHSNNLTGDNEFDFLAEASPEPEIRKPTVFQPRTGGHSGNAEVTHEAVDEMIDSRISSLTEMGFTTEQATTALRAANDDVNDALNMLFEGRV